MKLSQIKQVCLDASEFILYDQDGRQQWLGTRSAIYPVNFGRISVGTIPDLFDLSEKQMETCVIQEAQAPYLTQSAPGDLKGVEWYRSSPVRMGYLGKAYRVLEQRTAVREETRKVLLLPELALKPIKKELEDIEFYYQQVVGNVHMVICAQGMLAEAYLAPVGVEKADEVMEAAGHLCMMYQRGQMRETAAQIVQGWVSEGKGVEVDDGD